MDVAELERKTKVAELLLEAAREFGETLEPERVYERFRELLGEVVGHDGVVVSSYDRQEGLIRCEYVWTNGKRLDPASLPPLNLNREGGGMQSRVIVGGEPLLFNDVAERVRDPSGTFYDVDSDGTMRKLPESGPPETSAAMMVPVKHEGSVVGVVQVMSDRDAYSQEQLELVQGLVGQMAAAVRNARLQKERRRLEAAEEAARAVAEEREQAAGVLQAVGDAIFLVDPDGVVLLWNRAAELVTGLGADDVAGRPVGEALPDWEALAGRIPVGTGGATPRPATLPVQIAGRELWLSFVAVRHGGGVVYTFRDVSDERRLEDEKSDFIATISHELRTPMAAVHGAAQTLLRTDVELGSEDQRALLSMIADQSARLAHITEEVLLATRLDRGSLELEREPVDIAALARATVEAMRARFPAGELTVAAEAGTATGAADRIQQVLLNLLDNALKYGRPPVVVRTESDERSVRISVADSGPGVSRAEQQRIFEKFYRGGPPLTRPSGGTGLGLYISRELVQRMGGRLEIRSEPGAGATFTVQLPRA